MSVLGYRFLSYLWGMETDSSILIQQSLKNVLILPMRNGNSTSFSFSSRYFICSYPTYEEWKPKYSVNNRFPLKMFLSYLWGMETQLIQETYRYQQKSSYPTYEEWKLETATVSYNCWSTFLSYLWGMETIIFPSLFSTAS